VTAMWPVRFKPGVVGESRRTCHLVPVPKAGMAPDALVALCGQRFAPGQAALLDGLSGMPCIGCVALSISSAPGIESQSVLYS
jgi:hypothetical protein